MNSNKKIVLTLLIAACFACGADAFAATCSNILGPVLFPNTLSGNNCGNNPGFNGAATLCGGVSYSNTGTDAYAVQLGAAQDFSFSVTSSAFTPDIALLSGACADNSPCVNGTDYSSGTGTATSAQIIGNPAGTYYVIVTDSTAVGAQCGAYFLTFSAPLPVKLQDFSVQ